MLIRTPASHPTESLLGYVLRLSEANGYETPWHILKLAGFDQSQMLRSSFAVDRLAPFLNKDPAALRAIAYCNFDSGKRLDSDLRLLGHALGKPMRHDVLRLKRPSICPQCVAEDGFIDAFFDLSFAVACPRHGRPVLNACPSCGKDLTQFRPELLRCRCGASLGESQYDLVSRELLSLMAILKAVLHRQALPELAFTTGLPAAQLASLSMKELLHLIAVLMHFGRKADRATRIDMECVAQSLSDWPNGFYRFLHDLQRSSDTAGTTAFMRQYEDVYLRLFSGVIAKGREWMREAFIEFGAKHTDDAIVSCKMRTSTRLVDSPRISSSRQDRTYTSADPARLLFASPAAPLRLPGEQRKLGRRNAATYTGLPVSVLTALMKDRTLHQSALMQRGFPKADLDLLIGRMLALSSQKDALDITVTMSLAQIMKTQRFYDAEGKVRFVKDFLSGDIVSTGRVGHRVVDILFAQDVVTAYIARSRLGIDEAYPYYKVAEQLRCSSEIVAALVQQGLLAPVVAHKTTRVTCTSFDTFNARYVSLAALALELSSSSRWLASSARGINLELLSFCSARGNESCFVVREGAETLKAFVANSPSRGHKQHLNHESHRA